MRKFTTDFLYPTLDDPQFNFKIATRKEFADTAQPEIDVDREASEIADQLCNAEFELAPHQAFVRNFLSFQTPYNGLLLYHGLGSGKTCSAISVCEEMRSYMQQMGITKRIIIVASPNVQDNFKLQLFDERNLALVDGLWNLSACSSNTFIQEINPMAMKGLSRDTVVRQIKAIINKAYLFLGYLELANYIDSHRDEGAEDTDQYKSRLKRTFQGRLMVIDEVHNIRESDDAKTKRVSSRLSSLVQNAGGMRLLLLSATPMYNSPKEVAWLLNLLHVNDGREPFTARDLFTKSGDIVKDAGGKHSLIAQKSIGYVSFVKGDNPYTFPFRVWPKSFDEDHTFSEANSPTVQMNGKQIVQGLELISVYTTTLSEYQTQVYDLIVSNLKKTNMNRAFEELDGFGYTFLQRPLEALNICFPSSSFSKGEIVEPSTLVGARGLKRVVSFTVDKATMARSKFVYKEPYADDPPFQKKNISKYSAKLASFLDSVNESTGVILAYSQYIDGGLVPLALALEEQGYRRAQKELGLLQNPAPPNGLSYAIISGDRGLSPSNPIEVAMATNLSNKNGDDVKVILISLAGSEGLDFKFIRQVHVIDPWYNMNRIEQIIGRAVRTCSHKALPFEQRNVMLFLYASIIPTAPKTEAADVYVYRTAEGKAVAIGRISRILKENAVDCLLRSDLDVRLEGREVAQVLSNGKSLSLPLGNKPFSAACDYLESCQYSCAPTASVPQDDIKLDTYAKSYIMANTDRLITRIRQLFAVRHFYFKRDLVSAINVSRSYPAVQINAALDRLVTNGNEFVKDKYGRPGRLQNIADLYVFLPLEVNGNEISLYQRSVPIQYKRKHLMPVRIAVEEKKESVAPSLQKTVSTTFSAIQYALGGNQEAPEDSWYSIVRGIMPVLLETGFTRASLLQSVASHAFESLSAEEKVELLNGLGAGAGNAEITSAIRAHVEAASLDENTMLVLEKGNPIILSQEASDWKVSQVGLTATMKDQVRTRLGEYQPFATKCGPYVGFLGAWKDNYLVFKIKDSKLPRNKGARCDQSSKASLVKKLSAIGYAKYASDTRFGRTQLCCITEIVLRHLNTQREQGLKWFATPAIMHLLLAK